MIGMSQLVIAIDLDQTVIDSKHRVKFKSNGEFDLDNWIENSNKWEVVSKDTLLPLASLYREFRNTGFSIICVTARKMQDADFRFLKEHNLEFDMILHREDSQDLDNVLKSERLTKYFEDSDKIPFMAFDDKQENLEIFDKFGFRTFHANYINAKLMNGERSLKPKDFLC